MKCLLILFIFFNSFDTVGQSIKPVKIRVARGHIKLGTRLYEDRIYVNQFEFDIREQSIMRRKNEAKKFKAVNNISFPPLLNDSSFINEFLKADEIYIVDPCKRPAKNFFYKVDFIYCSYYPTIIKSYEINFNPAVELNREKNIIEQLIGIYLTCQENN